jgi:hypothetical protein
MFWNLASGRRRKNFMAGLQMLLADSQWLAMRRGGLGRAEPLAARCWPSRGKAEKEEKSC